MKSIKYTQYFSRTLICEWATQLEIFVFYYRALLNLGEREKKAVELEARHYKMIEMKYGAIFFS